MPNNNAPFGLKPVDANLNAWGGKGRMVCFPAAYASNVFLGDPVVPTGAADDFGVPIVNLATAGATNPILGPLIGLTNGPAKAGNAAVTLLQSDPVYRQASVLQYGLVCDDPDVLFTIQEDSVGGAIPAANAGFTNGNLVAGAGSLTTGLSGWMLDSSTVDGNANPTYQVRILGLMRGVDNALGEFAKWVVKLNLSAFGQAGGF